MSRSTITSPDFVEDAILERVGQHQPVSVRQNSHFMMEVVKGHVVVGSGEPGIQLCHGDLLDRVSNQDRLRAQDSAVPVVRGPFSGREESTL